MRNFLTTITAVFILASAATTQATDNWPQWRGAKLDSVSGEANLPESFDKQNLAWRIELPGPGGASPIVWDNRIFVSTVDGEGVALLCVSTAGELQWKQSLAGKNTNIRMDNSNSASPSPVTDGEHVWVMMTDGILHCFNFDGDLQWKKDLQDVYGKFDIQFGMSSTPLLDNGKLYLQLIHGNMRDRSRGSVGKLVALNANDGKEVWVHVRATEALAENKHAYTSPTIFRNAEREFLVVHGADYTTGHDLQDGSELWRVGGLNPKGESYNPFLRFVSSPVCSDSLIVVPTAKNGPVVGLAPDLSGAVDEDSDGIKWKLPRGTPDVATPLISGDLVYLARENGVLICIDAKTGEQIYEERLLADRHRSTPVVADGRIYVVGRNGSACVIADGREFKLISRHELGEDTTASPAISNGRIYVRTNKSLMAFENRNDL